MIYLYAMAVADKTGIHFGYSSDILKTIKFYKEMPCIDPVKKPRLVYLEGRESRHETKARFEQVNTYTTEEKIITISTINPDFIELLPGHNIDI